MRVILAMVTCLALGMLSACRQAGIEQVGEFQQPDKPLPEVVTLVIWNAQKGQNARFGQDLADLVVQLKPDLVFLQEAHAQIAQTVTEQHAKLGGHFARSWSYPWPGGTTIGVMTLSEVEPAQQIRVTTRYREFVVTAPKTSLITYYPLADGQLLLAINLHMMAFERFSTRDFAHQLTTLAQYMVAHDGPIIFAGDFNTWSEERLQLVQHVAGHLRLQEVDEFAQRRSTADKQRDWLNKLMGINTQLELDRVFVRGFEPLTAEVLDYQSSDHSAIKVTLVRQGLMQQAFSAGLSASLSEE